MAKPRSRILDYAVYFAVRVTWCILTALPLPWSVAIARTLALVGYYADRRHRLIAIDNLRRAFPGVYSEDQLCGLTRDMCRHFALVVLEIMLIPRKSQSRRWRENLVKGAAGHLDRVVATGRPLLIATAHYGNWELAAFMLRFYGIRAHLVARRLDNPYLDDLVRRFRESCGHTVLSKRGDLSRMREVLAGGGALCTLVDQDAGSRGLFVDFFGRPASTHTVIAYLAKKTRALIVVIGVQNMGGPLNYRLRATDIIDPDDYAAHPDAVFAVTQRVTAGVERLVRCDPRQYFWLHQRWKHKPPVPAAQAAAA
jgi:Kdo2-lipid IVA lauroyltransferase/acyltransferase